MPWCVFASLEWLELLNNNNCCTAPLENLTWRWEHAAVLQHNALPSKIEGLNQMTNGIFTQQHNYWCLSQRQRRQNGLVIRKKKQKTSLPRFFEGSQRKHVPWEPFKRSILENEIKCWIVWSLREGLFFLRRYLPPTWALWAKVDTLEPKFLFSSITWLFEGILEMLCLRRMCGATSNLSLLRGCSRARLFVTDVFKATQI